LVLIAVGTTWLSWLLLLIVGLSGLELMLARRAMQRRSVWDLLTSMLGGQQPVPASLRNHQGRFSGIVGRSFRQLVQATEQGTSLRTAIGQHGSALPDEAQAYASIDAIPAAHVTAASGMATDQQDYVTDSMQSVAGQQLYQRMTYLSTVLLIMAAVVTFLAIKIIPTYQAIFADFYLELPAVTKSLIAACDLYVSSYAAAALLLVAVVAIFFGLLVAVLALCDIAVLRPIMDRLFFTKHRALVLRLFAVAAQRGQPFAALLDQLTEGEQQYPSRYTRQRLRQVRQQISAGEDWKQALCAASLIKTADLPMLETAQQADHLPWVLRLLAGQKVRTMIFRWSAIEKIVFPIAVLCVGMVVLWICVALFIPLVELINSLA
jgi:type II secretory pathway component PulF